MPNALLFHVEAQLCALPLAGVIELAPMVQIEPLPRAQAPVLGYIIYRGEPIVAVDLRGRLVGTETPPRLTDHLIVARLGEQLTALRVDRIVDVVRLPREVLDAADSDAPIYGVMVHDDSLLYLADPAQVLSAEEAQRAQTMLRELADNKNRVQECPG